MDLSNDQIRRDAAAANEHHRKEMGPLRQLLARLISGDEGLSDAEKADTVLGGLARRRFLTLGGLTIATAAVVAACGPDQPAPQIPEAGVAPSTTGLPTRVITDVVLFRTASSIEHSLVNTYDGILGSRLPAAASDVLKLFRDQHAEHAAFFEDATRQLGGEPFTDPNPVFQVGVIDPTVKKINENGDSETDVVWFVYGLEALAAGTYQSVTPTLTTPPLRASMMSVGGVEARHATIVGKLVPGSFVVPVPADVAAALPATTTTTVAGPTTTAATPPPVVYQVPGPFGQLTPVQIQIGNEYLTQDIPGSNSYTYLEVPTAPNN